MPAPIFTDGQNQPALQGAFGSREGFGRWTRYRLSTLNFRMSLTTCSIAVPGDAGELALCHLGETMLCRIDTFTPMTIAGAATASAILIRLPDGYGYRPRASVGGGSFSNRHISSTVTTDSAGVNNGSIFEIGARFGPNILAIFKDVLGTAWPNGAVTLTGQTFWENFPDGAQ